MIGKLDCLEKSTRGDLSFAVHQCARFSSDPKKLHANAVQQIGRHLISTRDQGLILSPNNKSFKHHADASFSGDWVKDVAPLDVAAARSRSGHVIMHAGCAICWFSKLQTEIALSTCEAKHISLSTALKEVICLMDFMQEMQDFGIHINSDPAVMKNKAFRKLKVHCEACGHDSAASEMPMVPKMRPQTRHIKLKHHHFRTHFRNGKIKVHAINTKLQVADVFTKPLPEEDFLRHHKVTLGW